MKASALAVFVLLLASPAAADDEAFVAALREVLQEDHADIRDPVWILEASGFAVSEIVAELVALLPGLDAHAAVEAAYMLGRIGARAAPATLALDDLLRSDRDLDARCAAVRALGLIGPAATSAVADIAAAAEDSNPDMRAAAAEALRRIDPAGKIPRAPTIRSPLKPPPQRGQQ